MRTRSASGIRNAWHGVQLYEDSGELCSAVTDYLASGLTDDDRLIVVAEPEHSAMFCEQLSRLGHDVGTARTEGRLVVLDARTTLARILRGTEPDWRQFRATITPLLRPPAESARRVRIFGEMVGLLWAEGRGEAALMLEQFWNELHEQHSFWLLCSYRVERKPEHARLLRDVCAAHTHILKLKSLRTAPG